MNKIKEMVADILRREGGFVDHPNDRGGPTNLGITLKTLKKVNQDADLDDLKNLTPQQAEEIYLKFYYYAPKIDTLPSPIQPQAFDMAVNHGPRMAVMLLQDVLQQYDDDIVADGFIGHKTRAACRGYITTFGESELINALVDRRIEFYNNLARNDNTQEIFLRGWIKRAKEFQVS